MTPRETCRAVRGGSHPRRCGGRHGVVLAAASDGGGRPRRISGGDSVRGGALDRDAARVGGGGRGSLHRPFLARLCDDHAVPRPPDHSHPRQRGLLRAVAGHPHRVDRHHSVGRAEPGGRARAPRRVDDTQAVPSGGRGRQHPAGGTRLAGGHQPADDRGGAVLGPQLRRRADERSARHVHAGDARGVGPRHGGHGRARRCAGRRRRSVVLGLTVFLAVVGLAGLAVDQLLPVKSVP